LTKGADAVVRLETLRFAVSAPGLASTRVRRAVTVLNANGRKQAHLAVYYDKFRTLKSLTGILLDAQGRKIRELKKNDVQDYSAITDYSLYEDHRVRVAELYHEVYPYTVVFEYQIDHQGLISWPSWYPQESDQPVEYASFELTVPADMPARYRMRGAMGEPKIENSDKQKILRWEARSLPKFESEPHGPSWSEQAPSVLTAPANFEIADYGGDMSTWKSFGKWFGQLAQGRTVLPPALSQQVQVLTAPLNNPRDKAKALYEYLQSTTRYVSVQLGIGGWQPFDAAYVHARGYGDCKALSNYMIAMLQAAGVEAYPVLIRTGEEAPGVLVDFPSNQFNHMIACAPMGGDTLWLECTSQTMPFGHLGSSNEDRNVLLVTPEGGKLCRTPRSKAVDNQQIRNARVTVEFTGNARAEVRTRYTGNQQDRVRQALAHSTPRDREDWLRRAIDIGSFQLTRADFSGAEDKQVEITLPVSLELPRFASVSGTRLFLRPNLMERRKYVPPVLAERRQPVNFNYAYVDIDSIAYRLPPAFVVEAPLAPAKIETAFGSYQASADFQADGSLLYVRRLEMRVNRLPAEQYEEYRQFLANVVKADGGQVVLVRKN
jgi:transglutaminase-like putative cysteine protease